MSRASDPRPGRLRVWTSIPAGLVAATVMLVSGCAAPAAEPAAGVLVSTQGASDFRGTQIDPPLAMPTQAFTDTEGRAVTLAEVADGTTVVIFAYTKCPDVCNAQLAALAAALRRSSDEVQGAINVVMVTTDPARDDRAAMRSYLDGFGDGYVGLRAELPTTQAAAQTMGVSIERGKPTGDGGYEVDHTAALFGFNARQEGVVLWQPGVAVADLVTDLETLVTP